MLAGDVEGDVGEQLVEEAVDHRHDDDARTAALRHQLRHLLLHGDLQERGSGCSGQPVGHPRHGIHECSDDLRVSGPDREGWAEDVDGDRSVSHVPHDDTSPLRSSDFCKYFSDVKLDIFVIEN